MCRTKEPCEESERLIKSDSVTGEKRRLILKQSILFKRKHACLMSKFDIESNRKRWRTPRNAFSTLTMPMKVSHHELQFLISFPGPFQLDHRFSYGPRCVEPPRSVSVRRKEKFRRETDRLGQPDADLRMRILGACGDFIWTIGPS